MLMTLICLQVSFSVNIIMYITYILTFFFFRKKAGILEKRAGDAITGETFKAIIQDTFLRLKYGDRFFYDLGPDTFGTKRFKLNQLNEIRKASIARILCDNTGLDKVQPQAFKSEGFAEINDKIECTNSQAIPKINMEVFRE